MSEGFRVDTGELEAVTRRLRALQQNISQTSAKSRYDTVLARKDFGGEFHEADRLATAHDTLQQFLADAIAELDRLIDDYGSKTQAVGNAYREREDAGTAALKEQLGRLA